MPRTFNANDNYSDAGERTVGVAQTVTGTTVSVVPRRVTTQQTVQLTLTGVDTGASRTVNVVIDPPSGTGTVNFSRISPQTNNTNLSEMYIFTLANDSFAFLHVGDYQLHLDSAMPTTVPVVFNSEVVDQDGIIARLPDPYLRIEWGHFVTLALVGGNNDLTPFSRTNGSNQKMLSTVEGTNLYDLRIRNEFLQPPGRETGQLRLTSITTEGPIKLVTPTLRTQRLRDIRPDSRIMLEVAGPGMVSIKVEMARIRGDEPLSDNPPIRRDERLREEERSQFGDERLREEERFSSIDQRERDSGGLERDSQRDRNSSPR